MRLLFLQAVIKRLIVESPSPPAEEVEEPEPEPREGSKRKLRKLKLVSCKLRRTNEEEFEAVKENLDKVRRCNYMYV